MDCSLFRALALVVALGIIQGNSGVGYPGGRTQSIGQLGVKNSDDLIDLGPRFESADSDPRTESAIDDAVMKVTQCGADARKFGVDNANYLAGIEQYDWCAGYAFYRYTLEINGVKVSEIAQWERALRRYRSHQTKLRYGDLSRVPGENRTEWESDYSDWRADFDFVITSELQFRKDTSLNLENRKILEARLSVDGRDDFSIYRSPAANDDARIPVPSETLLIGNDMKSSNDPAIASHDKSSPGSLVCSDLDDGIRKSLTCFDVGEWMRSVLAIRCNAKNRQNSDAMQPHEATPSAREAH